MKILSRRNEGKLRDVYVLCSHDVCDITYI